MKRLTIKTKITLWFSIFLIIVVGVTFFIILGVSNQVIQKTIRDSLIETVENNVDEIEFITNLYNINDVDYYFEYEYGFLEIDDDFLDEVNGVYTSLYSADGVLMYGENPIIIETSSLEFTNSQIQKVTVDGIVYYVFDRQLTEDGVEGLWLRGVVSEKQGNVQLEDISKISLILLPTLLIISILGGYIIISRMLRPIQEISKTTTNISQSGDLKRRVKVKKGNDELHELADNFNNMIDRLDNSFQIEKQFTSDASHELRTPMAVIMAQCELSLEKTKTAEEYKEDINVIYRQGKKMTKLINDMLDCTRIELKANQYTAETFNLTNLCKSICSDMKLIKKNDIILEENLEDNVNFKGNSELMSRLLTNLISNAYNYGKKNGHIWVKLEADKDNIYLSVKDDGIGIAKEELEKIFNRFYKAENSHSEEGTGLGLSMVKEIATFHKGNVKVESEIGKGSTFTLIIPKIQ